MEQFTAILTRIDDAVWGVPLIVLIMGTGILLTVRLRAVQFRKLAFAQDRGVIYDVYCTNESGEQFIVEMQNRPQVNFRERALYYLSRAVARQGERGADWQFRLKAVYGVFFMNFCLDSGSHKLRTDIVLSDRETHEAFSDKLRFIFFCIKSVSPLHHLLHHFDIKLHHFAIIYTIFVTLYISV